MQVMMKTPLVIKHPPRFYIHASLIPLESSVCFDFVTLQF